jgi:hypothetical protein
MFLRKCGSKSCNKKIKTFRNTTKIKIKIEPAQLAKPLDKSCGSPVEKHCPEPYVFTT